MLKARYIAAVSLVLVAGGCASDRYYEEPRYGSASSRTYYPSPAAYSDEARVVAIDSVRGEGRTSGAGAVIGGIAGGVLGHQIGSGRGNTAATIAGAAGGALAGNEVERRRGDDGAYRITVQYPDGREATFVQDSPNGLRVGDRVRVDGGRLYRD
ncbi:MAG: glycine zipper 2TM domain-containing protein [Betaproteobacteria bacterium]